MKSLLLLPLLLLGVRAGPSYTNCYSSMGLSGYYVSLGDYAPNLGSYGIDDDIESVSQTGMWMYYEGYNYNTNAPGKVFFVHGINLAIDFPTDYRNMASSIRFAGSMSYLNTDSITFYEGTAFTANNYYSEYDAPNLGSLTGAVSSIIATGPSPWTVYTGEGYTGTSYCIYNTDHDTGSSGETLDLSIFYSVEYSGIPDNSIRSVRKGCWGKNVAKAPELKVDGRQKNGAWGRLL